MFIMKRLILLSYFFCVCSCIEPLVDFNVGETYYTEVKGEEAAPNNNDNEILNATLFKTVKKYYCSAETEEDEELIVYGTRAWTFPVQDVNLTLSYPSQNPDDPLEDQDRNYVLTGLKVVFHLSGSDSKGFITSGGMHQDHISMTFVFWNCTSLSYQFYLYGIQKNLLDVSENYIATVDLC